MLFFFSLFFSFALSQCWSEYTVNSITNFTYILDSASSEYVCTDIITTSSTISTFSFTSSFISKEIIIDYLSYSGSSTLHRLSFDSTSPNLQTIRVIPYYLSTLYFILNYINDNINIYYGNFKEQSYSTTKVYIYHYSNPLTFFADESLSNKNNMLYHKYDNSNNANGYPFFYIGGLSTFKLLHYFAFTTTYVHLTSLSGSYYLFTSHNVEFSDFISISGDENQLKAGIVCSRKDTERYVMFHLNHTTFTNCSCWTKNDDTEITVNSLFNYPDCNYNSTMFDLILPSSSSTYSLSDDLLEWYSILFTSSSQLIQINDEKTLKIDELDLNQDDISFNGNVYVKSLTLTTPGTIFNVLNFDNINYDESTNYNEILYTIKSTSTNLIEFGLEQINYDVYIRLCVFDGITYKDRSSVEFNDCNYLKNVSNNMLSLRIQNDSYSLLSNEYWNSLTVYFNYTELITYSYQLNAISCEFEDKTIIINGILSCETMSINSNTKLIVNGELFASIIIITDTIERNINQNVIIESIGLTTIYAISVQTTQSDCFELISSNDSLSQPSITSGYFPLLLSQNHLLRICPSSNIDYEVECTAIGNTFEQESFDILHCPCNDEYCTININTTRLDTRNIEFDGTFNILTNSTIAISYKTSSFSIQYEDDKQILLIGNGAVGFETLNTNTLKSETTTLSIQSSNQLYCKALLIQYNNQQCIIEDNTIYPNVGDIENCQLQNGYGCEICYEGYESNVTYCNECPSNCLRCYNDECINCEMNYQLNETNQCELVTNNLIEIFDNNKTLKCNDGYYSNTNQCIKCSDNNCITCNSLQCLTCNNSYFLNNEICQLIESNNGEEIISNYGVIDCNDGYYSNNSQCIDCSLTFDNCELCNINGCLSCSNGVIINNGSCLLNTNCLNIENSICLSCDDKGSWFNGNECISCGNNCKNCINGYCLECNDGYILQSENNCIENEYPDNCITLSYYGTCQRCSDGYYLNNDLCYECSNECAKCHNLTYCFKCNDGYMINSNNECVDMSESNANCKTAIPGSSGGCAICNDGYYREQTSCYSCISNCNKCNNGESCLICESNYFLLNDASECISYDDLTNCETKTQSGCTKCNDSYYLNKQYCTSCSDTTENCNTCNNNGECLTCQNDYILINYECINYQLIDNCKESSNSKCTSCSFWHTLNSDQTGCDTQVVWWVVVLIILFILIILIGICVLILYVSKQLVNWRKQQKQRKEVTVFDMSRSNIKFIPTNNKDVVINKEEILFNDESEEIGVNEETRDLICVGNTSKHTIKVQFSVKSGCDKYEIRTNPQLITIPKGKAVEFEIFIKPLCTCKIDDQIMLISVDLTKGKTIITPITINTITIMTTRLDYDELEEDIKLGEGSFGIVYKGTFRGNQVAIKKLKNANDKDEVIQEFNKEVQMLDKFRNDYIVHFYGAVFIPHKICMVTEFAQYGSLQDLMNNRKDNPIDNTIKMKILLDCSKGISYLHSNGILHRDIKSDNFLILSLDTNVQVNAKLTDFGSSRNINMLMTNMTFTKGIGTPKFMAPEILNRQKYKKSADIYSFAIIIYEVSIWNEAYSHYNFIYPWDIADFISKGERLRKPNTMNDSIYSLIDNCWKQEPKERYSIEEVISKLEEMN